MKTLNIFRLLLWNHVIYYMRQWHIACFTVLLQPIGFLIFTYLRTPLNISPKTKTNDVFYHPMAAAEKMTEDMKLFYAPHTDASDEIMMRIKDNYKPLIMKGFDTESEMIASMYGNEDYVGVVFDNLPSSCTSNISFPKNFRYRIRTRMNPKSLTSTMSAHEWPFRASAKGIYFKNFLGVQHAVDMSFIRSVIERNNQTLNVNITLQEMPYPPHEVYTHTVYLNYYIFVLFLVTNGVQVFFFTMAMAQEISSRMNTMLYGMGMTDWMYWIKWILHCFIPQQISVALLILVIFQDMPYSKNALLENTNAFLIFCCLLSYSVCLIATCFCCVICFSMIFNETHYIVIALMSTVFWFSHPMVLCFVSYNNPYTNQILKYLILLFPNVCVYLGIFVIAQYEQMGGLKWSQFFTGVSTLTSYPSIGVLMVMLTVDALLYVLVAWYLNEIIPSEYKVHQPWNFFYLNFFRRKKKKVLKISKCNVPILDKSAIMEEPSKSSTAIIQVRNLNKAFGEARQIITDLNVDIYENQLTVILSKERDAKSTILSIIAGFMKPSSGFIYYAKRKLFLDSVDIRKHIAFCPNKNVLMPFLTVGEHIILYGQLRGMSWNYANTESKVILSKLNLTKKSNVMISKLPKTLHHRVCLAIALIGNSQFILLDEPTWQMSPETKREFWDYMIHLKKKSTVVITLSDVQESEILADKILLMHDDRMLCYGSIDYIAHYFQTGYMLYIFLLNTYDVVMISNIIRDFIPNAGVSDIYPGCVVFSLSSASSTAMAEVLYYLDVNKKKLGISHFKVSVLNMDEVFVRAEEFVNRKSHIQFRVEKAEMFEKTFKEYEESMDFKKGIMIFQQIKGLLLKRFYYIRYKWLYHLVAFFLPILYESTGGYMLRAACGPPENKSITLDVGTYVGSISLYSNNEDAVELGKCYRNVISRHGHYKQHRKVTDVSKSIIELGNKDIHFYHSNLIVAAEINKSGSQIRINALYGNLAQHGPPIILNLVDETVLRNLTNGSDYSITVTNNPLPVLEEDNFEIFNLRTVLTCSFYGTLMTMIIHQLFEEEHSGFRNLQLMTGLTRIMFWLCHLLVDLIFCGLSVTLTLVITYFTDKSPLSVHKWYSCQVFGVMLILFVLSNLPFCYICAIFFQKHVVACVVISMFVKLGLLLHQTTIHFYRENDKIFEMFFAGAMPSYAFAIGSFNCIEQSYNLFMWDRQDSHMIKARCKTKPDLPCCNPDSYQCKKLQNFFMNDDIILSMYALAVNFLLYTAILFIIDFNIAQCLIDLYKRKVWKKMPILSISEELDNEDDRIMKQLRVKITDAIIATSLGKWQGDKGIIDNVTFGVRHGECLGILGKYNSGKTTLVQILTGIINTERGDVIICGKTIRHKKSFCQRHIGYCPQTDALLFPLTARQMIKCFAYLRGISSNDINILVSRLIAVCCLNEWCDFPVSRYSFGAVRCVNMALAIVGKPMIVIVDEPTTGVGPSSRQKLWNILTSIRKAGHTVVLATRNIEECEMICDRMAVLINGQFKCIGNFKYLREKYAVGFTAVIKFRHLYQMRLSEVCEDIATISMKFQKKFKSKIKEQDMTMLHFNVYEPTTNIAEIFVYIEGLKQAYKHIIEDYVVSNTTLDHVFLSLSTKETAYEKPWWRKGSL